MAELRKRIENGDPIALYQAVILCEDGNSPMPAWLTDRLLQAIAGYYLGKKAGKKGAGNSPLPRIRRQLELQVRVRAVLGVMEWQEDRNKYQMMPTKSIEAWFKNKLVKHSTDQGKGDALRIASIGLKDLHIQKGQPAIKCSEVTLRRTLKQQGVQAAPIIPPEAAVAFGFNNPDNFFGTDQIPPLDLE
ncbi:hypothetical protein P1J78_21760 [Psychromarinibacter sp. C21-152]|uniref:Uncharacterized protein n=1 Tax=Psychromarinibacter sediminicola TaxID=3033385 RepID=A0AAE3NSA4_9RHOB|nr:hypothetical protein [Psychromarinibacter sediminicola]MDF0603363.1 hypothetical protein [Psychromarinibacter sediminicola]